MLYMTKILSFKKKKKIRDFYSQLWSYFVFAHNTTITKVCGTAIPYHPNSLKHNFLNNQNKTFPSEVLRILRINLNIHIAYYFGCICAKYLSDLNQKMNPYTPGTPITLFSIKNGYCTSFQQTKGVMVGPLSTPTTQAPTVGWRWPVPWLPPRPSRFHPRRCWQEPRQRSVRTWIKWHLTLSGSSAGFPPRNRDRKHVSHLFAGWRF